MSGLQPRRRRRGAAPARPAPAPGVALAGTRQPRLDPRGLRVRPWAPGGPALTALALLPCAPAARPACSSSDPSSGGGGVGVGRWRGPASTSLRSKASPQLVPWLGFRPPPATPPHTSLRPCGPLPGVCLRISVSRAQGRVCFQGQSPPPAYMLGVHECPACRNGTSTGPGGHPDRPVSLTAEGGPQREPAAPPAPPSCWGSGWGLNPQVLATSCPSRARLLRDPRDSCDPGPRLGDRHGGWQATASGPHPRCAVSTVGRPPGSERGRLLCRPRLWQMRPASQPAPSLYNSRAKPCRSRRRGGLPGSIWNKKKGLPLNPEFKRWPRLLI